MSKELKDILVGLFVLIIAMSDAVYIMTTDAMGLGYNKVRFYAFSIILVLLTIVYFFNNQHGIPQRARSSAFTMIIIVIVLFYSTRFFYDYNNGHYNSLFLSLFSRFAAPILVGISMLGDNRVLEKVEKALPLFVFYFTIILARYILSANVDVNLATTFQSESGITYQTLSYYSIYMYGFAMYLLSYGLLSKFWKVVFWGLAMLCVVLCIMTGGRGAIVLGVVFTLFFFGKKMSFSSVMIAIVFVGVFVVLLDLLQSNALFEQGLGRITGSFGDREAMENDSRHEYWNIAKRSFSTSPIWGHGLGSIFYEVGQYSHNVFLDVLCEGGILLLSLFAANLFKFASIFRKISKRDNKLNIILTIFLCGFILLCFSGYYLAETSIWLPLAYILPHKFLRTIKKIT